MWQFSVINSLKNALLGRQVECHEARGSCLSQQVRHGAGSHQQGVQRTEEICLWGAFKKWRLQSGALWALIISCIVSKIIKSTLYVITGLVTCHCEHYENSWSGAGIFVIPIWKRNLISFWRLHHHLSVFSDIEHNFPRIFCKSWANIISPG